MITMTTFCGYDLELSADAALGDVPGVTVRPGSDREGGRWLIVGIDEDPEHLVWVCVPVSARALHEVVRGHASVRDVVRHSLTGTVEVVAVVQGRAVPDRCLLCADLPDELLPPIEARVRLAA
jgi:hypothetical protein